jgi:hypothetical protein
MQADVDGERGGKARLAIRLKCRHTREEVEAELEYEAIWSKWVTQESSLELLKLLGFSPVIVD